MKRNKWIIGFAILMLVLSNVACDDDTDAPDVTGTDSADEMIDDVNDAADDTTTVLDTVWCMDASYDWQIRCGGDGVEPTD